MSYLTKLFIFLSVFGLISCAADSPMNNNNSTEINTTRPQNESSSISGNIIYSGDASSLKGSKITIQLNDVSLMDVASVTLGKQKLTNQSEFPIAFKVNYKPKDIQKHRRYSVSARIEKGGKLLFINDTHIPVFDEYEKSDAHNLILPVIKIR